MACSGTRQGTAGAKRGRKPKVDVPMEDALLVKPFCSGASPGDSTSSESSAGIIQKWDPQIAHIPCLWHHAVNLQQWVHVSMTKWSLSSAQLTQLQLFSGHPDSPLHMSDVCSCQHAQLPALVHVRADVTLHRPKSPILPGASSRLEALD